MSHKEIHMLISQFSSIWVSSDYQRCLWHKRRSRTPLQLPSWRFKPHCQYSWSCLGNEGWEKYHFLVFRWISLFSLPLLFLVSLICRAPYFILSRINLLFPWRWERDQSLSWGWSGGEIQWSKLLLVRTFKQTLVPLTPTPHTGLQWFLTPVAECFWSAMAEWHTLWWVFHYVFSIFQKFVFILHHSSAALFSCPCEFILLNITLIHIFS